MTIASGLQQIVWSRAAGRCEYCRVPADADVLRFCIDHVIPRKHGGATVDDNLALACAFCNRYKLDNLSGIDPETTAITTLFNPRRDAWNQHFCWHGAELVGLTSVGRATIEVLRINLKKRVEHRQLLFLLGKLHQR